MSDIEISNQFVSKIDSFCKNNNELVLKRINELTIPKGYTVTKINKVGTLAELEKIIKDFEYTSLNPLMNPVIAFSQTVINTDSCACMEVGIKYSKTLEEEVSYSFSESILVGTTAKISAKGPISMEIGVNTEFKFEAGQSLSKRESRTWEASNVVSVEPGHSSNIQVAINNATITSPFTAKLVMGPKTIIGFQVETSTGPASIGMPIIIFTDQERLNQLALTIHGMFNGTAGIDAITKITPNAKFGSVNKCSSCCCCK